MIILNNLTSKGMWENHQKNVEKPDKYIFLVKKIQFVKEFTLLYRIILSKFSLPHLWNNRNKQKRIKNGLLPTVLYVQRV